MSQYGPPDGPADGPPAVGQGTSDDGAGAGAVFAEESPRRSRLLYAVVAVLAVLASVGVGYGLFLLTADDGDPGGGSPQGVATGTPTAGPGETSPPAEDGADAAGEGDADADTVGMNAAMAREGDCLVNDGAPDNPEMRIVACDDEEEAEAGQVFQVVDVVPEAVEGEGTDANEHAQELCADTDDYTHHYYEVAGDDSFVLCMTERD